MRGLRLLQGMVLVCILLIPVLIFLFLKGFGTNTYSIPVFYEHGVNTSYTECQTGDTTQHYIPDFTFTNQNGDMVGRADMAGQVTIVNFFFTSCPSICPKMSGEMERVSDMFRNYPEVRLMSISIDPEYDTPEILKDYADKHNAKAGKWDFLTGDKTEIYKLARCGFVIPAIDGLGVADDFIHSDRLTLVDSKGRIRGYYGGTDRADVDTLMLETKVLLSGEK